MLLIGLLIGLVALLISLYIPWTLRKRATGFEEAVISQKKPLAVFLVRRYRVVTFQDLLVITNTAIERYRRGSLVTSIPLVSIKDIRIKRYRIEIQTKEGNKTLRCLHPAASTAGFIMYDANLSAIYNDPMAVELFTKTLEQLNISVHKG